jgi:hypothetical protein
MEIKKTLVAKVVGESMGVAEAGVDAPEVLVDSDKTLIEGRVIMDYGSSGDGKSTRAHSFARFYFMRTGKPIVLIAAEDSTKAVFQDLIDVGIVVPIFLTSSKTPLSVYERIVEGELPLPGEFDVIEKSVKKDGKDVVEKFKRQRWLTKEEVSDRFGAYIFEGLSTITENILDYFRETGRFPREQSDGYSEGGRTFMAASQTAFGVTQQEGLKLVKNSGMLPVARVLWTAHEAKGKDEMDGNLVRGPKLVGSAATNVVRKLVGVLLHTERVNGQIRSYFEAHADQLAPKIEWAAKTTVNPFFAKELKKKFPAGYFVPTLPEPGQDYDSAEDGLIPFLKLEEEIRAKSSDGARRLLQAVHAKSTKSEETA